MPRPAPRTLALVLAALLAACGGGTKEEVPSQDTFECTLDGARWLVRFTDGEARVLSPEGTRVNLYQVASGSGIRYTNGLIELRGKGMELTLIIEGTVRPLMGCKPVMVPKEDPNPMLRMLQPAPASPLGK